MTITKTNEDGKITLKLDGWLDTLSSPELGKAVEELTEAKELILDFENVEYIASSGLRQVVVCHRKAKELGADFSIVRVNTETMSIFQLTGLDKKLTITKA